MMNRIEILRKNANLSRRKLALKTNIPEANLRRYESGKTEPSVQVLIKLADFFKVSVDYLISREPKNEVIKIYRYYTFNEDYTLNEVVVTTPTDELLESEISILDESEFEALEYSLELNVRLSQILSSLFECWYQDKISDGSYEELTKILVNKKRFLVEVFERVDS